MEKNKPEWTLIQESKSSLVDKLFEVYEKDKYKARILYFNNRGSYHITRVVKFTQENGDFEICTFQETVGISITNKMYIRKKKLESIIYKDGKFWYSSKRGHGKFSQLTYGGLRAYVGNIASWNSVETHPIMKAFMKKFSWIRFISETPALQNMAFNTIVRNKLFNQTDALKFKFKVPAPVIKILTVHFKDYQTTDMFKIWKEMKQVLTNIESLKPDLMSHHMFVDTCKMARTLDKKVNCSWSVKRLVQMHNDWSKEITNTVLEFEEHRELNVAKIYRKFAEVTGYKLLTTNREVLYEGMTQKHCVATYINKIDNGGSGIYHINGYTLELNYRQLSSYGFGDNFRTVSTENKYLENGQFRGKYNCNTPIELQIEVEEKILAFNKALANAHKCDGDMQLLIQNKPKVRMYDVNFENNVQEFEIQEITLADKLNLLDINDIEDIAELPF
jgi:hypothetical protein